MSNVNAAKLIIENIQLLEQARNLLESELSEKFLNAVDTVIKQSVDNFDEDIIAEYNFYEDETWFLPVKWQKAPFKPDDSKTWKYVCAFYELAKEGGNDDMNHWWLSIFFKNDLDRMTFNFVLWKNGFNKASTKDWKEFVAKINQDYPQIEQLGFKFNPEGNWYLPIASLDKQAVIENYERDTIEDALTPISDALDILKQAHPHFDKIVQAAIAKFGRVEEETV
ncbi:hypothetical protein NK318_04270 [Acinetobacter junii]|uniref:hypothetical protein n=2 Tax=Acinetobacter junii TaxID=40215 RepID=UPI0035FB299D